MRWQDVLVYKITVKYYNVLTMIKTNKNIQKYRKQKYVIQSTGKTVMVRNIIHIPNGILFIRLDHSPLTENKNISMAWPHGKVIFVMWWSQTFPHGYI